MDAARPTCWRSAPATRGCRTSCWRRWRPGCRSWPRTSAATGRWSGTARTACWCRTATSAATARALRRLLTEATWPDDAERQRPPRGRRADRRADGRTRRWRSFRGGHRHEAADESHDEAAAHHPEGRPRPTTCSGTSTAGRRRWRSGSSGCTWWRSGRAAGAAGQRPLRDARARRRTRAGRARCVSRARLAGPAPADRGAALPARRGRRRAGAHGAGLRRGRGADCAAGRPPDLPLVRPRPRQPDAAAGARAGGRRRHVDARGVPDREPEGHDHRPGDRPGAVPPGRRPGRARSGCSRSGGSRRSSGYETLLDALADAAAGRRARPGRRPCWAASTRRVEAAHLDRLQERRGSSGWRERVRFVPGLPHAEIVPTYQHATLFATASATGSLDKAALEAAACGLPPIVCNPAFARPVRRALAGAQLRAAGDAAGLRVAPGVLAGPLAGRAPRRRAGDPGRDRARAQRRPLGRRRRRDDRARAGRLADRSIRRRLNARAGWSTSAASTSRRPRRGASRRSTRRTPWRGPAGASACWPSAGPARHHRQHREALAGYGLAPHPRLRIVPLRVARVDRPGLAGDPQAAGDHQLVVRAGLPARTCCACGPARRRS